MISGVLAPETLEMMFNETINSIQHNVESISLLTSVNYTELKRLPSNVFSIKPFPVDLYEKYNVEIRERHIYDYKNRKCLDVSMFPVHVDITL